MLYQIKSNIYYYIMTDSDDGVICWLYTYTDDKIDRIYIIQKINNTPHVIYRDITDNSSGFNYEFKETETIKKLMNNKDANQPYSIENLENLIKTKMTLNN